MGLPHCSRGGVFFRQAQKRMTFSLLQLNAEQLRDIAEGRIPGELAHRLEAGALPPGFVAARALSLLSEGAPEVWSCTYQIVRSSDDRIVGGCGFKHAPRAGRVEIGYGVSPSSQNQGAATQAVQLLVRTAFTAGATEVLAEIAPANHASACVAKKAGFTPAGSRVDAGGEYVIQWVVGNPAWQSRP